MKAKPKKIKVFVSKNLAKKMAKNWREELRLKFFDFWHPVFPDSTEEQTKYLESFISNLLAAQREELLRKVEEEKRILELVFKNSESGGYRLGISAVIKSLTNILKDKLK